MARKKDRKYVALGAIEHPPSGLRLEPGDAIKESELLKVGQTANDVKRLVQNGSLKEER